MKAVIVTACHNFMDMTKEYIESLRANANHPFTLVVVDNNSSDGTPSYLKSLGSWCSYVRRNVDLGTISDTWNEGIKVAFDQDADIIGLTQNDMIVTKDWLKDMVEEFDRKQDKPIGVVSGFDNTWLLGYENYFKYFGEERQRFQNQRGGISCTNLRTINSAYPGGLQGFASEMKRVHNRKRIRGINMSNVLFKRELMNKIGLFDATIGQALYEDVDYIYRIFYDNTWDSVVMPSVYVHHIGGGTVNRIAFNRDECWRESSTNFARKWWNIGGGSDELRHQLETRMARECIVYEVEV